MITTELQDIQDFNTDNSDFDYYFKIVLIGDSSVGKSCIALRYARNTFEETLSTIGAEFYWKEQVEENKRIKIQLWDTAGQERFRSITKSYFRNAHGIVLCFDLSNYESYEKLFSYWLPDMLIKNEPDCLTKSVIAIVGNKSDLERKVKKEQVLEQMEKYHIKQYFEVSAKKDLGVNELFNILVKDILHKIKSNPDLIKSQSENKIPDMKKPQQNERKCCN